MIDPRPADGQSASSCPGFMAAVNRMTPGLSGGAVPAGSAPSVPATQTAQQVFDRCLEVDRQLRSLLRKKSFFDVEVRQLKQQLKELYESVIFRDFAHAQTNDVEQLMWKTVFYHTIEGFRQRIQSATKAGENGREGLKKVTAAYLKYLDDARLFYKQLLCKLQMVYGDVGAVVELDVLPVLPDIGRQPQGAFDCRVSVQRCLIYLGDLSRYKAQVLRGNRSDWQLASSFYKQAGRVYPRSGNPYNQLGVIAFYLKDELRAVYYYFRSLSVATPFLTARENLKLLFEKNRGRYAQVAARGGSKPLSWASPLDAKQTMSTITAELSVCFVRISGILFDHINSEQLEEAKQLGFKLLRQLLTSKPALELLAAAPAADNVLLHLYILAVFSVYNTGTHTTRQAGRASGSDQLQLNRYHHHAAALSLQYAAYMFEAMSASIKSGHTTLAAIVCLSLKWVQVQLQLAMEQGKEPTAEKILAQTSFWKALCKMLLKCGEEARAQNINFRQTVAGVLPEELEFVGFEPFRIDGPATAGISVQLRSEAHLRLIRIIQGCRSIADEMQPQLNSRTLAAGVGQSNSTDLQPGMATAANIEARNLSMQLFCTAVELLYGNKDLSLPAFEVVKENLLADAADGMVKPSAPSSVDQGSSPLNTTTSASNMLGPQSGSTYRSTTFSSTGADTAANMEEAGLLESASADMHDLLASDTGGATAAAAAAAGGSGGGVMGQDTERQTGVDRLASKLASVAAQADEEDEEEEVIVFQPQSINISRPPSRAPEPAPSGSAGVSRAASAASFPVSPTVAHQQFNLFANDASLALVRLVTSGGVQLEQQLSVDSVRSEMSGGVHAREQLVVTPRGQTASPASSLKVSPAAVQLPEPPSEWTTQLPPPVLGLSQGITPKPTNKSSPKMTPLPVPGSMPPPPPTSLQLAAMSGTTSTTPNATAPGGYGFGAIGAQRAPSTPQAASRPAIITPPTTAQLADPILNRPSSVPVASTYPSVPPNSVPSHPVLQTPMNPPVQESIVSLLQQLQSRPAQDVPPVPPISLGAGTPHSSSLPPHPASPSLRGLAPSPTMTMPSRLSLSSSEQAPHVHATPAPAPLLSGRFPSQSAPHASWTGSNPPGAGVNPLPSVVPPPGFGDVLTLAQLEQATLAAHDESVANDQAEATAMAAIGQLLDDPSPPSHAPAVAAPTLLITSHPLAPVAPQYATVLPPMPSEKFLSAPSPHAAPNISLPTAITATSVATHLESTTYPKQLIQQPPLATPQPVIQHTSPVPHPLDRLQGPSLVPAQQYGTQAGLQAFGVHASDLMRASLPIPGGLLAKSIPGPVRQTSFPPAGSAASVVASPILNFGATPHPVQLPERETPNAGFSFLDILEAHHTQGVEYGAGSHLYNPAVAEAATVSYPMLVSSANMGYRTAEPLPP